MFQSQGHQLQLLDNGYRIIDFPFVKHQRFTVMVMLCCAVGGMGGGGVGGSTALISMWLDVPP